MLDPYLLTCSAKQEMEDGWFRTVSAKQTDGGAAHFTQLTYLYNIFVKSLARLPVSDYAQTSTGSASQPCEE